MHDDLTPDHVTARCREDKLCLQRAPASPAPGAPVLLTHPPFCPIKQLSAEQAASLPPDITSRGVNVGVVVILGGCLSVDTDTADNLLTLVQIFQRLVTGACCSPGGPATCEPSQVSEYTY